MRPIRNCAKAIIIRDGRLLTIKYSDEGGEYFALPGGGQLHGETLTETLHREVREELGLSVINHELRFIREYIGRLGESSWRDFGVHQIEFIYECEIEEDDEPDLGSNLDISQVDYAWVPIDRIEGYKFYPKKLIEYLGTPFPDEIEYWESVE